MIGAFTGTRRGMAGRQRYRIEFHAMAIGIHKLHHGACDGADREIHAALKILGVTMYMHPSNEEQHRWAIGTAKHPDVVYHIDPDPIHRNHTMVDLSRCLFAAPSSKVEQVRGSGTWATIRYARKLKLKLYIVWPDGSLQEEN